MIKREPQESISRRKNREDRENKGMSRRTASAPPLFGVNNWPAMRDGISSTGFLPMLIVELQPRLNLTRWQKILSHNCARPSDGIDRPIE